MANGIPNPETGGTDSWRKWTNYVLFVVAMAACTGFLTLYMGSIKESITNLKETMIKNDSAQGQKLDKVADKTDYLCGKVAEHETLLHIPFQQRQEYYKSFKPRLMENGK